MVDEKDNGLISYERYVQPGNFVHTECIEGLLAKYAEQGQPEEYLARLEISETMVNAGIDILRAHGVEAVGEEGRHLAAEVYMAMRLVRIAQK